MKKLLLFLLVPILLQSCRFDPEERDIPIIGRFSINQFRDGGIVSINHNYTETYATTLAEGNLSIKCDTIGKVLYIKEEVHEHYTNYRVFRILDGNSQDSETAYEEKKVNEKEFNKLIDDCKSCITVEWPYGKQASHTETSR
jgi:hypothetical protein